MKSAYPYHDIKTSFAVLQLIHWVCYLQDRYSSYFNETSKSCHCPFWSYIMQTYLVNDDKFNFCMEKHLLNWEAENVLIFHEANPAKLTWLRRITHCLYKLATSNRKSLAKMLNVNSIYHNIYMLDNVVLLL